MSRGKVKTVSLKTPKTSAFVFLGAADLDLDLPAAPSSSSARAAGEGLRASRGALRGGSTGAFLLFLLVVVLLLVYECFVAILCFIVAFVALLFIIVVLLLLYCCFIVVNYLCICFSCLGHLERRLLHGHDAHGRRQRGAAGLLVDHLCKGD